MSEELRKMVTPLEWEPCTSPNKVCRAWSDVLQSEFLIWADGTCSSSRGFVVRHLDEESLKAAAQNYHADQILAGLTPAAIAALSRAVDGPLFKLPSQLDASDLPERLWAAFEPDEGGWFVEALSLDGGHPGDIEFLRADLLSNPLAVHLNMLVGKIAKPSPQQIRHIYGAALDSAAEEAPADA